MHTPILIHKTDERTGEGIYGVSFLLYDSSNTPIGQYTSDDRGYRGLLLGGEKKALLAELVRQKLQLRDLLRGEFSGPWAAGDLPDIGVDMVHGGRDADLSSAWVFGRGSCLYRIGVSQLSHLPELLHHLGQPLDGKAQLLGGTAAAVECPGHGVDVAASLIRKGDGRFRLLLSGDGSRTIPGSRTHPNR